MNDNLMRFFVLTLILLLCIVGRLYAADLINAEKAVRTRDYAKAFLLYQKAADMGDAEAQYQLSTLYLLGKGVAKDETVARNWMQKSAAAGHPAAQYGVGLSLLKSDAKAALNLLKKSAAQGYRPAEIYLNRTEGADFVVAGNSDSNSTVDLWFGFARKNSVGDLIRLHSIGISVDQTDDNGRTALFNAIEFNRKAVVEWLLAKGANPDHQDNFGGTPAFLAVENGRDFFLQALFKNGANKKQTLPNGNNLLHQAVRFKQISIIPLLIKNGVPLNQKNSTDWTPLDMAEFANQKEAVAILKKAGAQEGNAWFNAEKDQKKSVSADNIVNASHELTLSNLAKVVVSNNIQLTKELLGKRPDLINQSLNDGSTLLSIAIKNQNVDMVSALLQLGADVNRKGVNGDSPLHHAVGLTSTAVIDCLLEAKANPLQQNLKGEDAVARAIQNDQIEIAALLVRNLMSNNISNGKNLSVDHYILLSARLNKIELVKIMASDSVSSKKDEFGRDALWYAASHNNIELIVLLLRMSFIPEVDKQGVSPFYVAVRSGCLECAKLLLAISDVNQSTDSGSTPIMAAAAAGDVELSQWLLKQKVNLDERNSQGNTALINAVQANAIDVVKLLVDAGANTSRKNTLGFSAIDIAKKQNQEIYELLKSSSVLGIF